MNFSELEEERAKRKQVEEKLRNAEEALARCENQLTEWHKRTLDSIQPGPTIDLIMREQINSLTYHLLKSQQRIQELESELVKARKELEGMKNIFTPSKPGPDKPEAKHEPLAEDSTAGQRISASELLSEEELAELLGMEKVHEAFKRRESKTIKDLIDLLIRLQRVKVVDASILLNVDKGLINVWVEKLKSKNLVQVEGARDPLLISTNLLVRVRQ